MCGIAIVVNGTHEEVMKMGHALKHRGKFQSDVKIDNIHAYFSWLPITDRSAGRQPFWHGKYALWLNGFISNWKELAKKYHIEMQTNCDTEFLVKFIAAGGYDYLHELNGFFSVVYYDGKSLEYFTDRYGIKQLYGYCDGGKTYIASEVKSLLAVLPGIKLDERGVEDWRYSLGVMNEHTIYKGVFRIPSLKFKRFDKLSVTQIDYEQAKDKLRELFWKSIERNKVDGLADGVFLSGGVDSGLLAKALNPDFCFSMDYQDVNFSEGENIKLNSAGIHYSMICNRAMFEKYKHETMEALDDLKAGSCYTNFALTELASKFCTVLYSGAGGDEVFNGYVHRYSKPIEEVIRRTSAQPCPKGSYAEIQGPSTPLRSAQDDKPISLTHKEYDWKYLKGILVVEDRMSGYHTMETRYPFLDNDLVDFALSLPDEYLNDKRILKDISGLDPKVLSGKKRGFSNPYCTNEEWIEFTLQNLPTYGNKTTP